MRERRLPHLLHLWGSIWQINRALRLEDASLRDPARIDNWARQHGMQPPQAGQIIHMDSTNAESSGPVMASVSPIRVITSHCLSG